MNFICWFLTVRVASDAMLAAPWFKPVLARACVYAYS